jgi:chromosome segregation ATPase
VDVDLTTLIATCSGLLGVGLSEMRHWLRARKDAHERISVAKLEAAHQKRIDDFAEESALRDRLAAVEVETAQWRDRYYEQKSEAGTARMERDACQRKYVELTNKYADLATDLNGIRKRVEVLEAAKVSCRETCDHQEGCALIEGG